MGRVTEHGFWIVVSAVAYLALSRVAEEWSGDLRPIPLWLATASTVGIALAVEPRFRTAVVVGGAVFGNVASGLLLFDESLRSLALPALSVLVEAVVAIAGITWAIAPGVSLRRTRRAIRVLGVSVASAALGASIATIETASPVITERADAWLKWAAGDLVGLLVVVPLVLAPRVPYLLPPHRHATAEAAAMFTVTIGATIAFFNTDVPLIYLIIPAVMWLAIRFGPRLSAPAALLVTVIATYLSGRGLGPFVANGDEPALQVQGFNVAVAACALVAGAHATRAWDDQHQLAATLRALPDAAIVRDRTGEIRGAWIPNALRTSAATITARQGPSDNPLTDIVPGEVAPRLVRDPDGRLFEHRMTTVSEVETLHLFRDVTAEHEALYRQRRWEDELELIRLDAQVEVGRVLHDGPIQDVSAALLRLDHAREADDATPHLEAIRSSLDTAVRDLRSLAHGLIPSPTAEGGILDALRSAGREILEPSNITFEAPDTSVSIESDSIVQTLYLVGREAMTNAAFHSQATHVLIELGETDDRIELSIADDGIGLRRSITVDTGPQGGIRPHLGLQLMSERLHEIGGELRLEPTTTDEREGLRVVATVPRHGAQS